MCCPLPHLLSAAAICRTLSLSSPKVMAATPAAPSRSEVCWIATAESSGCLRERCSVMVAETGIF